MKKLFCLLSALLLVFVSLPFVSASASDDIYDLIYERIFDFPCYEEGTYIDVKSFGLTKDEIHEIFGGMLKSEPELFFVKNTWQIASISGKVTKIYPRYNMTKSEYAAAKKVYDSKLNAIVALLPRGLDDFGKAAFFHDYICQNFAYDTTYTNYDVYSMLRDGKGVCEAYTLLYVALLSKVSVPAVSVSSTEINHAWNEVMIGGKWYETDLTWDDPTPDTFGKAKHTYFLCSKAKFDSDGKHGTTYSLSFPCTDKKYDSAEWRGENTAFGFADGNVYFLKDYEIKKLSGTSASTVYTISSKWHASSTSTYVDCFSGFGSYDDKLIFNDPDTILWLDPKTSEKGYIYKDTDANKELYVCYTVGDKVKFAKSSTASYTSSNAVTQPIKFYTDSGEIVVPEIKLGDVNGDGNVNSKDYLLLKRYCLKTLALNAQQILSGDVNKDGKADSKDYVLLKRHCLGTYVIK